MEAAFGRLHNSGGAAFGGPPTVVESMMVWLIRFFCLLFLERSKTRRKYQKTVFQKTVLRRYESLAGHLELCLLVSVTQTSTALTFSGKDGSGRNDVHWI